MAEAPGSVWVDVTWSYGGQPRERFCYQLVEVADDWQITVLAPMAERARPRRGRGTDIPARQSQRSVLFELDTECLVGKAIDVLDGMPHFRVEPVEPGPRSTGGGCSGEVNVRVSPVW